MVPQRAAPRSERAQVLKRRILRAMADGTPRRGRWLIKALVVLALLVVALVVGAVVFLDSIAKAGIATVGSRVLGVPTQAGDVSIGIASGVSMIGRLEVDNPSGYAPVKFVSLGALEVDAPFAGLTGDKIVIERIALFDLVVELEKGKDGKLNVERIVENIKRATGAGREAGKPDEKPADPAAESKEAVVRELRIERLRVNLRNIAGGKDGVVEVKLPDIVVRELSSKGGVDVLASELSGVVIGSVLQSVVAANIEGIGAEVLGGLKGAIEGVGTVLDEHLRGAVDAGVEGAMKALEGAGKLLDEGVKGAGKALEDGVKGVGNALEGVFGGKK